MDFVSAVGPLGSPRPADVALVSAHVAAFVSDGGQPGRSLLYRLSSGPTQAARGLDVCSIGRLAMV